MTEQALVAILVQGIASSGLVLVAVLPVLLSTRKKASAAATDAKAAREQVQNSHTVNFRDDHDTKHGEVMAAIARVDQRVVNVESDMRGMRRDIGRLADADARHDERIHDLERTQPQTPKRGSDRRKA